MSRTVIHRGSIPGTDIGHKWFEVGALRFGIIGWPHDANKGWGYEIVDQMGLGIADGLFSLDEIRDWADEQARYVS
jgi:hypothetical protein